MKKINLFCILAFIGAAMLSVTSCTKTDYGDDIAQLKNDVAELNNAIKAGKTVTAIAPIAGGNKLTFSDGTSIDILNGKDGVAGTAGSDAFAPILGVDDKGFWTIITTKGGAPVRVTDANNKEIRAVASYPTIGANGNWVIDGKDMGVAAKGTDGTDGTDGKDGKSPYICTNSVEGVLNNWMIWNGTSYVDSGKKAVGKDGVDGVTTANVRVGSDGVLWIDDAPTAIKSIESAIVFNKLTNTIVVTLNGVPYGLPLAVDVVTKKTITSVACPVMWGENLYFTWGKAVKISTSNEAKRKAFTGKSEGDYFFKSNVGSFLVNPTEVDTEGYSIELVDPKDNSMLPTLSQEWREFGYNGNFVQTKAKAEGGLWALQIDEPSKVQMDALVTAVNNDKMNNLAVKLTKGDYSVRSNYAYALSATAISNSVIAIPAPSSQPTVNCGESYDLGEELFSTVVFSDLYKWSFSWSGAGDNSSLKPYIQINGSEIAVDDSAAAINAVGGKTAEFLLQAVDYKGNYYEHLVKVNISKQTVVDVRLSKIDWILAEDNTSTSAASLRENIVNVPLAALFTELAKYGTDKKTFTYDSFRIFEGNKQITNEGFDIEPYVQGTATGSSNLVAQGDAAWSSLNIIFDAAQARPVEYTVEITYENSNSQTARVTVPVKVTNPVMDWSKLFVKNDLFAGDKIKVYGDDEAAQQGGNATYDLSKAFSTKPYSSYFDFKYLGTATSPLVDGKTCGINSKTVGVESKIGIVYYYFMNKNNSVNVPEYDFYATPRSFVADGSIALVSGVKAAEVTYDPTGGTVGSILMRDTYVAKTVNGKTDLKAFGTRDALVSNVSVYATGVNSNLITVTPMGNDFRISATNNAAGISSATVDLVIRIFDKMGKELYSTVKITVKN